jgi:DNA-binding response OmpR family regulator
MKVLVVEDVQRLANDIAEGLRDQGMAVDVAYDGLDAAFKIDVYTYDVVVLDRDLPGIDGDTICRMIVEGNKPIMVLMLTAAGSALERVAGLGLGADDYLSKPFHFPELVLRIRALMRRKPLAQRRRFHASGIELDPLLRTVTREGLLCDLSSKEFSVLEALLRASPAVLSAEELFEQVWDEFANPFTKTVQVTISRLRRKLGQPQIVETVPGAGYRIAASPLL